MQGSHEQSLSGDPFCSIAMQWRMANNHICTPEMLILSPFRGTGWAKTMEKKVQELKDTTNPERWRAVIALGEFGEPAVEHLHQALGDDDKWVRYFAADTLGNIGHRSSVDPLIQVLVDEDQDVRWAAAAALGRIGDPRATPALRQAYNSDNAFVKIFIAEALDKLFVEDVRSKIMAYSQV
jgi:HEAT repeat protein